MNLNIRKPQEVGVIICSDKTNHQVDQFGFGSEIELIDFIKDNLDGGTFIIYQYIKEGKLNVFNPFIFGDEEDLRG